MHSVWLEKDLVLGYVEPVIKLKEGEEAAATGNFQDVAEEATATGNVAGSNAVACVKTQETGSIDAKEQGI